MKGSAQTAPADSGERWRRTHPSLQPPVLRRTRWEPPPFTSSARRVPRAPGTAAAALRHTQTVTPLWKSGPPWGVRVSVPPQPQQQLQKHLVLWTLRTMLYSNANRATISLELSPPLPTPQSRLGGLPDVLSNHGVDHLMGWDEVVSVRLQGSGGLQPPGARVLEGRPLGYIH